MSSDELATFTAVDYVVFVLSLLISLSIGLYQWWKSRGLDNKDFLMGGGNMSPIPVSISLFAGVVSAVSTLGNPAEMYYHGSQMWMNVFGTVLGTFLVALLFMPVLYPLKLVSLYEILGLRWGSPAIKKLTTSLQLINYITYLGIALYAPSLALSSVTPIPSFISIVVLGFVCTVYASLGGAKAVVYTDTVQAFIMLAGIIAVIIQGCSEVGGAAASWQIDKDNGRIEFLNMSTDPLERHTLMSTLILGAFFAFNTYGSGQSQYQRYVSVATLKQAYAVVAISCGTLVAVLSLINYSGLVVFSVYADCDPLTAGLIDKSDQITAYFVIDKLGYLPGIPGLFVAAIYSGVLSTVSSVLNAMAAMIWSDLLRNLNRFSDFTSQQEKTAIIIISSITGFICTLVGLLAGKMGGLFQISYSLGGALGGPITGLLLTALLCPWVKAKSAMTGLLLSLTLTIWMVLGNFLHAPPTPMLPLSTDGCPLDNTTTTVSHVSEFTTPVTITTTTVDGGDLGSDVFPLYLVTYCLYGAIGTLTTLFVSNVMTLVFGPMNIADVPESTVQKPCMRFYKWILSCDNGKSDPRSTRGSDSKDKGSETLQKSVIRKKEFGEEDPIRFSSSSIDIKGSSESGPGYVNLAFDIKDNS